MTDRTLTPEGAGALVEARLGRPAQDMLEAAVVLEAWAGVPARPALAAASGVMGPLDAEPEASAGALPGPAPQEGRLLEGSAFVIAVVAIACWASPLAGALGDAVVGRALTIALPLTLALQWLVRRGCLDLPDGGARLARRRPLLIACGAAGVLAATSRVLGDTGTLVALLTIIWTGGALLIGRRWSAGHVAIVVAATVAMVAGVDALAVVAVAAAATVLGVAMALEPATPAEPDPGAAPAVVGVLAAATGAGVGLLLVLDGSVGWTGGTVPALALVPSAIGGLWAGLHLRRLEVAIPEGLARAGLGGARPHGRGGPALGVLRGAIARSLLVTGALSAALVAVAPTLGAPGRSAGVLAGFGAVAVASLLLGLVETLRGPAWALGAVAAGVAIQVGLRATEVHPFAGAGLLAGATAACAVALPVVVRRLSRPAETLATTLWIR